MMENFLAEYGLSTREGVALMCLSEALLRVPDAETIDALISDKITPSEWGQHLGKSTSSLINTSTWGLMLTGNILKEKDEEGLAASMRSMVKRLGEPVIRTAVGQAMKELGRQFVLGTTIEKAIQRGKHYETKGFTYSYDMLGEAARTEADGIKYHLAYSKAIATLAPYCKSKSVHKNPGLSVKLSALHPRYEEGKKERVMSELVSRTFGLALLARSANMNFTIDAEEMDRLDISLDVIEAVLSNPALEGWDGFGVVVQAFGHRASFVIDWLYMLSKKLDRKITVRLVKGAYWDSEIKRAQVMGLEGFPVFTRKANSDVSYLSNARRLLDMTDHIYPQFASHNAHTATAVMKWPFQLVWAKAPMSFNACMAWAMRCMTRWSNRKKSPAASMRRWGLTLTCWPIWSVACWKMGPTLPSSTRLSIPISDRRKLRAIPSPRCVSWAMPSKTRS